MGQHQENCFCCSDEPLLFLLGEFLLSVNWFWAAHFQRLHRNVVSEHADPIFSLRPLFFSSDLLFLVISASLPHSFHIHLLLILCQGYFSQSQSLFSLPSTSRMCVTMKRSLLHVLRWLREMTFCPAEDGDGCRSCRERQCLMFCLAAFGVSSKWIFFSLSGMRHTLWPFIFLILSPPTLQRSRGTWGSGPRAPPLSLVGLDYPFVQNMGAHWVRFSHRYWHLGSFVVLQSSNNSSHSML